MTQRGYTLDVPAPMTAREALDLAWALGHEVSLGQVIPEGARYLTYSNSEVKEHTAQHDVKIRFPHATVIRTVEPLPDPEPDWIDAPAVLASVDDHDELGERIKGVFYPVIANRWTRAGTNWTFHWNELRDVTPLYPKGQEA